ncbi:MULTISPECIES: OsmC family protein [unclassified Clostridium]|uniref:OsmC family protein n=1 Tax=unclassified Clostridium TaxID=2614128 RepID=UPI00029852E1|nr:MULTISPECIES: OsmC family protein [unclassified Clostridium]EKQ57986.1 MAG: putative redox protein, regulator of disulfide bond formation [Clostridium sp. Maddingley MBC34-26]
MITSISEDSKYITSISNGNETIYSDVTKEKGGNGQFFRPHDLIEAGYASCLNITTRMILDSMNIEYNKIVVAVDLDRRNEKKTIFKYKVDIIGIIDESIKNTVIKKLKNCPVTKTLSKEIEFQCENK